MKRLVLDFEKQKEIEKAKKLGRKEVIKKLKHAKDGDYYTISATEVEILKSDS